MGILDYDDIWTDLSRFFGVDLEATRANVTGKGEIAENALPIPPLEMKEVLGMIAQRSAADALVYEALLIQKCGGAREARQIADAAFAEELIRFGDLTGSSATKLNRLVSAARKAG